MPRTVEKMSDLGKDAAFNPFLWDKIKHSPFVHKHKNLTR